MARSKARISSLVAYEELDGERERVGSVVSRRLSASVLASLGLWDRMQLGLELPPGAVSDR